MSSPVHLSVLVVLVAAQDVVLQWHHLPGEQLVGGAADNQVDELEEELYGEERAEVKTHNANGGHDGPVGDVTLTGV